MDNANLIFGLFALIGLIVYVAEKVSNQRTVAAFTAALTAARDNKPLIDEIHNAAVDVVPVATLHKALDTINTLAGVAKAYLPANVDAAIDATTGLVGDVVNDGSAAQAAVPNAPAPAGASAGG